ncbi:M20/M25/M40 family metallo-hydrolase [Nocardioides sp. CER19]|uniref:M20/M25/M40 family metallo-hydrolase n=1 Tax=Nocardioides sp. CER19 TaxID=3038538 RepID=UPI002449073C|nr:M20/M25/M40 family metallo-hydrolase [Nocardioides sp. CER19]MDH2413218.1 M20/M25/M40 family metallo-hydrolase [Nocardioides sp. CER19]
MTDPVERLAALIRIPTVSHRDPGLIDTAAFDRLLETMSTQWPLLHALEVTRIGSHGLLVHWAGRSAERPVVLMAHLDVVPVVPDDWSRDPFGGEVVDGEIWGRGTLDDKGCVAAICEAVESLLADGFVPAQDVWLSFGCDEEVSGGAAQAAVEVLRERGVAPWFVLDEGGAIAHEAFPGVVAPVGVVGVTEKGTTSVTLTVTGDGGHASTPVRNGPTVRLAKALAKLDAAAMPARLPAPTIELFRRLAPHAPLPLRALLGNAQRLAPVVSRALTYAGAEPAAMVRTTFAITTLTGSPALNVIAASATAGVNIRVMVGDSVANVVEHVRSAVDDKAVAVEVVEANEPSPVSPYSSPAGADEAFDLIESAIVDVFPDAVPAPYVMMAATDSRFFTAICERVYRFAPFRMTKAQRAAIHAADERLGTQAYLDGVGWYRRLIERLPA